MTEFYKMDGAGNDFVVVDNREGSFHWSEQEIAHICHRRFGVGADGLMTLDPPSDGCHFGMHYYNSDGRLGSMCGNGGRCIALFAHLLGMGSELTFQAYDGLHNASILRWDAARRKGTVRLSMRDVACDGMQPMEEGHFLDTGSPHFVLEVNHLDALDVRTLGRQWRQRTDLFPHGANIDFVQRTPDGKLHIRTYERGVEDETLACGTGITAAALVMNQHSDIIAHSGSTFHVDFRLDPTTHAYTDIHLTGPVSLNFIGQWTSSLQ